MKSVRNKLLAVLSLIFSCGSMILLGTWLPEFFGGKENIPCWVHIFVVILIGGLIGYAYPKFVEIFSSKEK